MNYKILFPNNIYNYKLLKQSDIQVVYNKSFNRKNNRNIDSLLEKEIIKYEHISNEYLFNKNKFRLHSINYNHDQKILRVNLGITDYFNYLSTNHNAFLIRRLIRLGLNNHNNEDAYLSNALGNVAIVILTDRKIVFLKRNNNVFTFQNYYDLPGGHPEPEKCNQNNQEICNELFNSIKQELIEELNIDEDNILDIFNFGFLKSLQDGLKPEMLFLVPINLSSIEVENTFKIIDNKNKEANELLFIDYESIHSIDLQLTAVAEGAINLFKELIGGRKLSCINYLN